MQYKLNDAATDALQAARSKGLVAERESSGIGTAVATLQYLTTPEGEKDLADGHNSATELVQKAVSHAKHQAQGAPQADAVTQRDWVRIGLMVVLLVLLVAGVLATYFAVKNSNITLDQATSFCKSSNAITNATSCDPFGIFHEPAQSTAIECSRNYRGNLHPVYRDLCGSNRILVCTRIEREDKGLIRSARNSPSDRSGRICHECRWSNGVHRLSIQRCRMEYSHPSRERVGASIQSRVNRIDREIAVVLSELCTGPLHRGNERDRAYRPPHDG